jgi:GT2 family glycosyltransferase
MDVSIVIVNWNTRDLLRDCLESIADCVASERGKPAEAARLPLSVETIVADSASSDGSAEMVATRFPKVRLFAGGENLGWAKGNNVGIRAATGRYVFLLNPDTLLKPGALEALTRFMDEHPEAGACAPRLLNPDGTVQSSLRRFPEPVRLLWDVLGMHKIFPHSARFAGYRMGDFDYDRVAEVEQPMGAALFIRREAFEAAGEIDESFPIFFNDVDWCYRAVNAGWRIYFVPDAEIVHYGGSGTRQAKPRMIRESHRSLERFYRKHYRRLPGVFMAGVIGLSRVAEFMRIARANRAARLHPALSAPPSPMEGKSRP